MSSAVPRAEDGNERVLKYVIDTVDSLCEEYSSASQPENDKRMIHWELSMGKILDELQMPSVERAKNEVLLLTKLHASLTRLLEHSEKVLSSTDIVERLKAFREEMQALFNVSSLKSGNRRETGIVVVGVPGSKPQMEEETSSTLGPERTETPPQEAARPGHEKDRTERVTELQSVILRNLHRLFSSTEQRDESSDTDATKTPTRGPNRSAPDERSDRIWIEESIGMKMPAKTAKKPQSPSRNVKSPSTMGETETILSPTVNSDHNVVQADERERVNLLAVEGEEPTILKAVVQPRPVPSSTEIVRVPQPTKNQEAVQDQVAQEHVQEQVASASMSVRLKVVMTIAVIVLSLLLVWAGLLLLGISHSMASGHRANLRMMQVGCNVANTICENYGSFCYNYCASGLQREKWRRR